VTNYGRLKILIYYLPTPNRPDKVKQKKPNLRFALIAALSILSLTSIGRGVLKHRAQTSKNKNTIRFSAAESRNWGIANTRGDSHIHALDAWKLEQGSKRILVAVIDTGIDPNHPDLKANIYRNQKGHYGWNFVTNQPDPFDDHGHGTHVAGIVGATANAATGVSGVSQHVSIMAVKYYSDRNSGAVNLKNTIKAIEYAVNEGARIINYSGGGPEFSRDEYLAIKRAEEKGVMFIAAAGNERQNTDLPANYYYPSAYRLPNILSVAATDVYSNLLRSSNWGAERVDIAAPGENIYSTLPNNRYGYMSGTSQATAFVTGVAALILSARPELKPFEVREVIRNSADSLSQLKVKVASGGKLNAYKSLLALGLGPNSKPNAPSPRTNRLLAERREPSLGKKLSRLILETN